MPTSVGNAAGWVPDQCVSDHLCVAPSNMIANMRTLSIFLAPRVCACVLLYRVLVVVGPLVLLILIRPQQTSDERLCLPCAW